MSAERRMAYALAERRGQFRVAAETPAKLGHLRDILRHYPDGRVLVTGKTAQAERERCTSSFVRASSAASCCRR